MTLRTPRISCLRFAAVLAGCGLAAAAPPQGVEQPPTGAPQKAIKQRVAAKAGQPSVHQDRSEIDAALLAAGVPHETIARLWAAVDRAVLPGVGSPLDGFLFFSRDPEWLKIRDQFAEFLTLDDVPQLTKKVVGPLTSYDGVVSFPAITTLDAASAKPLRRFGAESWGAAVELPGITDLAADAAAALATCRALVVLPNLRGLSTDTARALALHEGVGLVIGGFAQLPDDVAAALAECQSLQGLLLPDLETLDSEPLARRLAQQDHVFLPRLTRLTPPIAAALRGNGGGTLSLPGLTELSPDVATQLAGSGYFGITLGGAATLRVDSAKALALQTGPLVFTGTACFSAAAARELACHPGDLVLPHLTTIPADVAAALAGREHLLVLQGLTTLDAATATTLAACSGLSLPGVQTLDPAAAAAFSGHRHQLLLDGVRDLPVEVATALAAHPGPTHLSGIRHLSLASATALAECPDALVLDGLQAIDAETAAAFNRRTAFLSVGGLTMIESLDSPEVARLLVRRLHDLELPNVTALEGPDAPAIAATLAEGAGRLSLPALERITPRALSALLRKADVEIPDVASLNLVPDPGGGADDFVDPRP